MRSWPPSGATLIVFGLGDAYSAQRIPRIQLSWRGPRPMSLPRYREIQLLPANYSRDGDVGAGDIDDPHAEMRRTDFIGIATSTTTAQLHWTTSRDVTNTGSH